MYHVDASFMSVADQNVIYQHVTQSHDHLWFSCVIMLTNYISNLSWTLYPINIIQEICIRFIIFIQNLHFVILNMFRTTAANLFKLMPRLLNNLTHDFWFRVQYKMFFFVEFCLHSIQVQGFQASLVYLHIVRDHCVINLPFGQQGE